MRQFMQRNVFCFVIFLMCGITSVYAAVDKTSKGSCLFDDLMKEKGPLQSVIIQSLPLSDQKTSLSYAVAAGDEWEPLRITISDEDLRDKKKMCTETNLGQEVEDMRGGKYSCGALDVLTAQSITTLTSEILPKAIKLHTERLLVRRLSTTWKVPQFNDHICHQFTVPSSHRTNGVSNTDMMFYIAAAPFRSIGNKRTIAWAIPCAHVDNRPVVGAMNFQPSRISVTRHTVRTTAHEIGHALGFGLTKMEALGMVSTQDVRGKGKARIVKSPQTQKMARLHYNCGSMEGMELEDGENGTTQSHWERRNAKDELMAPFVGGYDSSVIGFYSVLTLAAFEDMGYFKANYSMAEPMEWGNQAGCNFVEGKCVEKGVSKFPNMFCDTSIFGEQSCPSDRLGVGGCSLRTKGKPLPEHFRYFLTDNTGGNGYLLTDYCPVVQQKSGLLCSSQSGFAATMSGSVLGKNSWCLDGDSLLVNTSAYGERVGGICAEVKCDTDGIKVRYLGTDKFHDCPEGEKIVPKSPNFINGSIKCPKYAEVCIVLPDGSSSSRHLSVWHASSMKLRRADSGVAHASTVWSRVVLFVFAIVFFIFWQ